VNWLKKYKNAGRRMVWGWDSLVWECRKSR